MFNMNRETDVVHDESTDRTTRLPRSKVYFFTGPYAIVIGIGLQFWLAAPTLTCRPESPGAMSCVVTRSMFFGLVPIGSEQIAGVRGARIAESRGAATSGRGRYWVVLDTTAGARDVGSSFDVDAAAGLLNAITQSLSAGAPLDGASFSFGLFDWGARTFGLIGILYGVGMVVAGLIARRREQAAQGQGA
jgi:hypothetical protein